MSGVGLSLGGLCRPPPTLLVALGLISPPPRYKYEWKVEEARKNLLRTHTTSASARALYHLACQVGQDLGRGGRKGKGTWGVRCLTPPRNVFPGEVHPREVLLH